MPGRSRWKWQNNIKVDFNKLGVGTWTAFLRFTRRSCVMLSSKWRLSFWLHKIKKLYSIFE